MLVLKSKFLMFLHEGQSLLSQSSQSCFCEKHSSQSQVIAFSPRLVLQSLYSILVRNCSCISQCPYQPFLCLRLSKFPALEIGSVLSHVCCVPRLSFDKQYTLSCLFVLIPSCYYYTQTLYKSI